MSAEIAYAPHVLCIVGSPRRGGNSDRLAEALIHGVQDEGGVAVAIAPSHAGIAPCRGCNACSSDGRCIVHDGMNDVYPLLDSANAIAVVTPVYFASVPASLKALYDRCQPYWARRYVLHEPRRAQRRPGALLVVGGGGDPFGTQCAVTPTRSVMNVLEVEIGEAYEYVGIDKRGDIERYPEMLAQAEWIGGELVRRAVLGRQTSEA